MEEGIRNLVHIKADETIASRENASTLFLASIQHPLKSVGIISLTQFLLHQALCTKQKHTRFQNHRKKGSLFFYIFSITIVCSNQLSFSSGQDLLLPMSKKITLILYFKRGTKLQLSILPFYMSLFLLIGVILNHPPSPHTTFSDCQRMLAPTMWLVTFTSYFELWFIF